MSGYSNTDWYRCSGVVGGDGKRLIGMSLNNTIKLSGVIVSIKWLIWDFLFPSMRVSDL